MAINKEQLYDYWKSLDQPASSGGGDIPYQRADQTADEAFGSGSYNLGVLEAQEDKALTSRDEAMQFSEQYAPETGQVDKLSTHLQGVLESDSPYIQRARTAAKEQANKGGMLHSSMAAGAAEGAAIDRGLDVARGDLEADQFNVGERNRAGELRYDTATGLSAAGQQQQNQLSQAAADNIYKDYFSSKEQQDTLERLATEFKNTSSLDWQKYMLDMDKSVYENTEQRVQEMLKQSSLVASQYLKGWAEIQSSDMSPTDKIARLREFEGQISKIQPVIEGYADIKILSQGGPATTDEFYSIQ